MESATKKIPKVISSANGNKVDNDNEEDIYWRIISQAPYIPGHINDQDVTSPAEDIPWLDKSLLKSVKYFQLSYVGPLILLSSAASFVFIFCYKSTAAVIAQSGKLTDPKFSFKRYLATNFRGGKMGMFEKDPKTASKTFTYVRRVHQLFHKRGIDPQKYLQHMDDPTGEKGELARAVSADLEDVDTSMAPRNLATWEPEVVLSQFDMLSVMFCFAGMVWHFSRVIGLKNRMEELKGFFHVWAIYGRMLGLKDEFNICIEPKEEVFDKLWRNTVVANMKEMDGATVTFQKVFMDSFQKHFPFMTYKALLYFTLKEVEGFKGEKLWGLMTFGDKLSLGFLKGWTWAMRNVPLVRIGCNVGSMIWFYAMLRWYKML